MNKCFLLKVFGLFFLPASSLSPPSNLMTICTRFVTLDKCDYVVAARYRDYDQHSTRASKVVQDILATKEKWQTVRLYCTFGVDARRASQDVEAEVMHVAFVKSMVQEKRLPPSFLVFALQAAACILLYTAEQVRHWQHTQPKYVKPTATKHSA